MAFDAAAEQAGDDVRATRRHRCHVDAAARRDDVVAAATAPQVLDRALPRRRAARCPHVGDVLEAVAAFERDRENPDVGHGEDVKSLCNKA